MSESRMRHKVKNAEMAGPFWVLPFRISIRGYEYNDERAEKVY